MSYPERRDRPDWAQEVSSRLHRRVRELGPLDEQVLPRDQPGSHPVGPRITWAASRGHGRSSWTRLPAAAPFRSKPCAWVRMPLPATSIPLPVLLNKVVLEYIPKYGQRLADEVRKWGEWISSASREGTGRVLPGGRKEGDQPIAYLWARTILSEAPTEGAIPRRSAAFTLNAASQKTTPLSGSALGS